MRIGYSLFAATIVAVSLTGCSNKSVYEMEVGMCFNVGDTSGTATLTTVPTVACSEPHDAEVFFIYNLTGVEVFDQDLVSTEGSNGCIAPFQDYVGADFFSDAAANLDMFTLFSMERRTSRRTVTRTAPTTAPETPFGPPMTSIARNTNMAER